MNKDGAVRGSARFRRVVLQDRDSHTEKQWIGYFIQHTARYADCGNAEVNLDGAVRALRGEAFVLPVFMSEESMPCITVPAALATRREEEGHPSAS